MGPKDIETGVAMVIVNALNEAYPGLNNGDDGRKIAALNRAIMMLMDSFSKGNRKLSIEMFEYCIVKNVRMNLKNRQ